MERGPSALDEFFVRATAKRRPRVCFIPTGSGDSEEFLSKFYATFSKLDCRPNHLAFFRKLRPNAIPLDKLGQGLLTQDAIYVGGGNTRSMLAVWREWGLDRILRKAWRRGILLGGISAGAICWFQAGASDSVPGPGRSSPLRCLGFLRGSCVPHFNGEPHRRRDFSNLISRGKLPHGIAIDDGAAVLFQDQSIVEVVASRGGATAYRVMRRSGTVVEVPLAARQLRLEPNRRLQPTRQHARLIRKR